MSQLNKTYMDMMVAELSSKKTWKRPKTTIQEPSTQRVLDMTDDELIEYRKREVPISAQVRDEKGDVYVKERQVTPREVEIEGDIRRKSRNTLGDATSSGEGKSASIERKEIAISHFTCSPSATIKQEDKQRITGLEPIKSEHPVDTIIKESLLKRFMNKIFGSKSKIDKTAPAYLLFKSLGGKDEDYK